MNLTIENLHYKITAKFDYLNDLLIYVKNVFNQFQDYCRTNNYVKNKEPNRRTLNFSDYIILNKGEINFRNIEGEINSIISDVNTLYYRYNDVTSAVLSEYYDLIDTAKRSELKEKFEEYQ